MRNNAVEKLRFVDYLSLEDMAQFFEEQAETLREQAANQISTTDEARQANAIDFLYRSPRIVMRFLNKGESLEFAIEKTAQETGAPVVSIERAWRRFTQDKNLYTLRRRNRLILELVAMGFTNADIGRKVNLHPNSVSRIIAQTRQEYRQTRGVPEWRVKAVLSGGLLEKK